MQNFTQKITSLFLVALMLAFTVGISVYEHYCGCSDQKIASVFVEVTCSDNQGESCCSAKAVETKSCCSESSHNTCEHESSCDVDGCCKTNIEIIQIDSEYQVSQEKATALELSVLMAIIVSDIISDTETKIIAESFYSDPSPPVYGRQFLTAVHQLKFDIPVC
ncbi:MAG: hypothetical protein IH597_02555 [Bacteroidales bacterium]|nr:hypothetical protein [Bacteroidales bacterium]